MFQLQNHKNNYELHRIDCYLLNFGSKFHSLWNFGKSNNDYMCLIGDNIELTSVRRVLAQSIQNIIKIGFYIICREQRRV